MVRVMVKAIGISTPPKKPCSARRMIIWFRFCAKAQATDITRNMMVLPSR